MPWQPQRRDSRKALVLVLLLHLALGAALLRGLAGPPLEQGGEALVAFDLPRSPPPPPPPEPPPAPSSAQVRKAGAVDLDARPAPILQPPPIIPLPPSNTLPTADEAAPLTAAAQTAGAGRTAGPGSGAGGSGDGPGGGGSGGEGSGNGLGSEARLLSGNLSRGDYRRIRGFGAPRGQAVLAIEVGTDGRLARCMALSSSGNPALDDLLCRLLARTRWEPARSRSGAPVAVSLRYVATWDRD